MSFYVNSFIIQTRFYIILFLYNLYELLYKIMMYNNSFNVYNKMKSVSKIVLIIYPMIFS
jgi:hypothetical protein